MALAGLLVGVAGCALWLIHPETAIYGLILICPFTWRYDVGELKEVMIQDLLIVALAIGMTATVLGSVVRKRRLTNQFSRKLLWIWVALGVWGSVAYLLGPENQWLLKDPVRNSWYVYKQVWRPLMPFPLIAYCLGDRKSCLRMIDLLLVITTFVSSYAIWLSWSLRTKPSWPFEHRNDLAGFLAAVVPFAAARVMLGKTWRERVLCGGLLLILIRALWLTGSRGALVAALVALIAVVAFVPTRRALVPGVLVALTALMVVITKEDLAERPNVQRYLTLGRATQEGTFQWRQEQWGFFFSRVMERPLLGTGSGVDRSLLERGRLGTAHNAYLSVAVRYGVPAALIWLLLLVVLTIRTVKSAREAVDQEQQWFWAGMTGFICSLHISNLVETNLFAFEFQQLFWILAGVAAAILARPRVPGRNQSQALQGTEGAVAA